VADAAVPEPERLDTAHPSAYREPCLPRALPRGDRSELFRRRGLVNTPRIWTVEEANAMVPRLSFLVGRQLAIAGEIERCWKRLVEELGGSSARPEELLSRARRGSEDARALERVISDKIAAYEAGWREVQELGLVVKDPQVGLCDFHGRVEGKLVYLCWRYGEDAVAHYHDLDAGFSGRKPLTAAARQRLLN